MCPHISSVGRCFSPTSVCPQRIVLPLRGWGGGHRHTRAPLHLPLIFPRQLHLEPCIIQGHGPPGAGLSHGELVPPRLKCGQGQREVAERVIGVDVVVLWRKVWGGV